MRFTIAHACLLFVLSIQTVSGQNLTPLGVLQDGEDQQPSRIRYEFIDILYPHDSWRTTNCIPPPKVSFGRMKLIESSPQPYIPWLTTGWVAFGDQLVDPMGDDPGQTEAVPERKISDDRLLKQKLAERDKLLEEIERLRNLTGRPGQVVLHVKILEASPDVIKELGLNRPFGTAVKKASGDDNDLIRQDGSLAKRIEKARSDERLKVLATPSVISMSGRPATLLSGGEFPIFLSKADGKNEIEWREYGTRLEFVMTNLGKQRLRLEISTEVSALDSTTSVTVAGQKVPGLTVGRSNTQVEIQLGQTIVLAGLVSTRESSSTRKKEQVELVTLVRCEMVDGTKTRKSID